MTITINGEELTVSFKRYAGKKSPYAIILLDKYGSPYAKATINHPDIDSSANEVGIKSYSENAGMLEHLFDAGLVSAPIRHIPSGNVSIPVCNLLVDPEDY